MYSTRHAHETHRARAFALQMGCNNRPVSYNRRHQRHQGVRYGPPRQRERFSDNGVVIGRLLGLGILLLTLGVLAAGAVAFIGDRRPGIASRRPTLAVTFSPPSVLASLPVVATIPPTGAAPTAPGNLPTAQASPRANAAPQVQIGPGFVTFGTRSDRRLHIVDPRATFALSERVVWSAFLTERADSIELRVHIVKLDGTPPSGERLIADEAVTPLVRGAQIFERRILPSEQLDGPGIYAIRYVRGTQILSEGSLEITN